ncbi:hypothetical protein [Hyphomicrobium sp. D-2]|uniref:hypothetical protein n=1 Tax=Hyphomicrobium sp. D-2 TaxID=3041621 RepID=UPI0024546E42|nr:hypothetical protein [Hyphomicrobium sp. D-2]MDH4982302.1 hypothetical protein [Hyphomicrobium sp. D-2]
MTDFAVAEFQIRSGRGQKQFKSSAVNDDLWAWGDRKKMLFYGQDAPDAGP